MLGKKNDWYRLKNKTTLLLCILTTFAFLLGGCASTMVYIKSETGDALDSEFYKNYAKIVIKRAPAFAGSAIKFPIIDAGDGNVLSGRDVVENKGTFHYARKIIEWKLVTPASGNEYEFMKLITFDGDVVTIIDDNPKSVENKDLYDYKISSNYLGYNDIRLSKLNTSEFDILKDKDLFIKGVLVAELGYDSTFVWYREPGTLKLILPITDYNFRRLLPLRTSPAIIHEHQWHPQEKYITSPSIKLEAGETYEFVLISHGVGLDTLDQVFATEHED